MIAINIIQFIAFALIFFITHIYPVLRIFTGNHFITLSKQKFYLTIVMFSASIESVVLIGRYVIRSHRFYT